MSTEEIEIIVTAKVEKALKEFEKIVPTINKIVKQVQDAFSKVDTKTMTSKLHQAVNFMKKKMQDLKNSSANNEIAIKVNNKNAQNQISQIQKQIDSLQEKINARQIKLNVITPKIDKSMIEAYNIEESFSIAWNYNGNGDAIVQNLSKAFNNLLGAINNVVLSKGFQDWLNNCSDKFRVISEKLAEIDWQPLVDALSNIGQNIGTVALDILSGMVDILKWVVENPIIAEIILGIAIAIGVLSIAYKIWSTATEILTDSFSILNGKMIPFILKIIAIIVVIALIVVAIINWDNIMNWLKKTVKTVIDAVVGFFTNLWNQVSFIFEAIWNVISTILGFIWNLVKTIVNAIWQIISTIFQSIWNILSTILNSIWNIFSQIFNWIWQLISKVFQGIWNIISPIINKIWETIKFVLGKIQEIWSNVWNTISKVVNNVWNGIWSGIKSVINFILGGIEGFVNGTIKGINKLLSGISSVANAVGSLIGLDPINLQISTISLPRLAKGGVLTEATAIIAGEYSGAKSNPEIVTPQNIMRDTFEEVLSDFNSNNGQPLHVTIQYLGKEIFDDTIDYINSRTRRTGKNTIVTVGN